MSGFSGSSSISSIRFSDSLANDAYGRLRASNGFTLFESKQVIDNRAISWSTALVSGGTSVWDQNRGSSLMGVTSTIGSRSIRQTKQRFTYQTGKAFLMLCSFIMGSASEGIIKRVGYFDENNGIFFEHDGTTAYFKIRSHVTGAPIDIGIAQSNWNIDKLDGTGSSGIVLDITKIQVMFLDFAGFGSGRVRVGFTIDGVARLVHQFTHANIGTSVYMSTPNLPMRYEIHNISSNIGSSLEQIAAAIISEGGYENKGYVFSVDRGIVPLSNVNNSALYPLISLRLDNTKPGAVVTPQSIHVMCTTTTANFKWALILNPTVGGSDAASWQNITNSVVQYDISRVITNTLTGGTVLSSGYGIAGTVSVNIDIDSLITLGLDIVNISDQLVLAVQKIDGSTDSFIASIAWREYV